MDWTGAIGLIGAVAGAAASTWAIIGDRSRMRTAERAVELVSKMPDQSEASASMKALIDDITADMLKSYRNPSNGKWQFLVGIALATIGISGLLGLVLSSVFETELESATFIVLMTASVGLFSAGYALMLLAVLNRRRHRLRQRTRVEMASYKTWVLEQMRRSRWRPSRRRMLAERLRRVEADIARFDARTS